MSAGGAAWPVTVGIPFAPGAHRSAASFAITGANGALVPAQLTPVATWEDGSLRWVHADFSAEPGIAYTLVSRAAPGSAPDDLVVAESPGALIVTAGHSRYSFRDGAGSFTALDSAGVPLAKDTTFAMTTAAGERAVFAGSKRTLEVRGARHTVVRIAGEYLTAAKQHLASATVDFHFYAGHDFVRIAHELVFDRDMNSLAIADLSMSLPLAFAAKRASFGSFDAKLDGGGLALVQDELPHFGQTNSAFRVVDDRGGVLDQGPVAADWARATASEKLGLAVQLPYLAEQFPAGLRVSPAKVEVALWAREAGRPLDLRTGPITASYFGNDWIPADHACTKQTNLAQGMARTHELWIAPHADRLPVETYAFADPAYVASTGVFGVMHARDVDRFPELEDTISAWFDRNVVASKSLFPATGFLYWGMHPYGAQPWEQKDGRWYPKMHRLARGLDYNLKRGAWMLYARSGERKYRDYARTNTRFVRDVTFSHSDAPVKPKGWIAIGPFHCPIVWGMAGEKALRKSAEGKKPGIASEASALAFASSEDVVQFAYDWFFTGDLFSRDMSRTYARALLDATRGDAQMMISAAGPRPEIFLRMIGSAYELEHDKELGALGAKLLGALAKPDGALETAQWGKWGEVFSAYYYYWISTRDPLAKKVLVELAQTQYRKDPAEAFLDRASPLFEVFAIAADELGDPTYIAYLERGLRGIALREKKRPQEAPHGREMLTIQGMITIGLPAAEAALARVSGLLPKVPVVVKPAPTAKTTIAIEKTRAGAARIDLAIEDPGARGFEPKLADANGRAVAMKVVDKRVHRMTADDEKRAGMTEWVGKVGEQRFYRLELSAAPGSYSLDVGDDVAFTVLAVQNLDRVAQVAPEGVVLVEGEPYFVRVAGDTTFFASLPIEVTTEDGSSKIAVTAEGNGRYRFAANGVVRLVRPERPPSFVRMENGSMVIALGDASRLPSAPARPVASPAKLTANLDDGRFAKGAHLADRFVETKVDQLPRETGTVEFWMRPAWSATDVAHEQASTRIELYAADPIAIVYGIDPDPDRSGDYNRAVFLLQVKGGGSIRTTEFLRAGKWYHVAATWKFDGVDNEAAIFIDGKRRSDSFPSRKIKTKAKPEQVAAPNGVVRFGSAHVKSALKQGETFDELRVSDVVRYDRDFTPPERAFTPDAHTKLLLHFDGAEASALLKTGNKLR